MSESEEELARRRASVRAGSTDVARWTARDSFPDYWDPRAAAVAPLLEGFGWVCDIGCGQQALRRHLAPGVRYLPADLRAWTPDTETCDLNAGQLPLRSLRLCDAATLLGVLEYIPDPATLLRRLGQEAEHLVLTYCATDLWQADRAAMGWMNAMDQAGLRALVTACGYRIVQAEVFDGRQLLLHAVVPGFPLRRRVARRVARARWSPP